MKISNCIKIAALALPLLLGACGTKKKVINDDTQNVKKDSVEAKQVFQRVNNHNAATQFVSSKLKFSVEIGNQQISLTGNLRMKRDDVIRLQLMAFGFVEAARIEFTKEDVLIMDRVNKQYLKAPYKYVEFLRNSGINFYTLQALFWNELFLPGKQSVGKNDMAKYTYNNIENETIISYDEGRMNYSWMADIASGRINLTNILYRDSYNGNTQLSWDYKEFSPLQNKLFPSDMAITLTTSSKEVKLRIKLNYLGTESDWETRTTVSDKYREVMVDDILRRFMAL